MRIEWRNEGARKTKTVLITKDVGGKCGREGEGGRKRRMM